MMTKLVYGGVIVALTFTLYILKARLKRRHPTALLSRLFGTDWTFQS